MDIFDLHELKKGDPIVVIHGPLMGRLGYFGYPYPYPEGGEGFIVDLISVDPNTPGTTKAKLEIDDLIPLATPKPDWAGPVSNEDKETIGARYSLGQRIIISEKGEYRGSVGYIRNIIPRCGGLLFDYDVAPTESKQDDVPTIVLREEDIVPLDYRCTMVNGIDIGKYITTEFMTNVAMDIYEQEVKKSVDQVIANRTMGSITIVDWIFRAATEKYIDQMDPKLQESFITRIKEYIEGEKIGGKQEWSQSMEDSIDQHIINAAEKYMRDHMDDFLPIIKSKVEEAAKRLTSASFVRIVNQNIDFSAILTKAFNDSENNQ